VHGTDWHSISDHVTDVEAQEAGGQAIEAISALRKFKSDNGMPLNAELATVTLYAEDGFDATGSVRDAMHVTELDVIEEAPNVEERIVEVDLEYSEVGPAFGELVGQIEAAIAEPASLDITGGTLTLALDEETVELEEDTHFTVRKEYTIPDTEGELRQTDNFTLVVRQ